MTPTAVVLLLCNPGALACDKPGEAGGCQQHVDDGQAAADPALCARLPELVGRESCAWTTTMMAQRVLEEGQSYSYVGHLVPTDRVLASKVATPYTIGPGEPARGGTMFVIANEVLDALVLQGGERARVQITGRVLEVEDVTYFVPTVLTPVGT